MNSIIFGSPLGESPMALSPPSAFPIRVCETPGGVAAGFPSPAEDLGARRIDLMARLVKHPQATFVMRAKGNSMRGVGIFDGDALLVDRAIDARGGHVVIAVVDGDFVCKTLWTPPDGTQGMRLKAANPAYPDIVPKEGQTVEVWGVVVAAIKEMRI